MAFADSTCQDCIYGVDGHCRRFPPVVVSVDTIPPYGYPRVASTTPACGEFVLLDITPPIV